MRVYSVYEKQPSFDGSQQYQRTLVPEGFSWSAYAFGPFWILYHRLWRVGVGYLGAVLAVLLTVWSLNLSAMNFLVLIGMLHFLLGLEGFQLLHSGPIQKSVCSALIFAQSNDDAELCFYATAPLLLDQTQSMASPQVLKEMAPADILGLFSSTSKL